MYVYVVLCDGKKAGAVQLLRRGEKCGEGNFCLTGELG